MRIVHRKTFMEMPEGTVFAKFEPCVFDELCIKGESFPDNIDFFYQPLVNSFAADNEDFHAAYESGASAAIDLDIQSRDGCFDYDQLFAVWERTDVEALIARLQETLA